MPFSSIISGLRNFNSNAWGYVGDALNTNADDIVYINQSRIIDKGLDSEKKKLRNKQKSYSGYSPPYEKKKKRLGLYNGHINLYLSGEYLGSMDLKANSEKVDIYVIPNNADLDAVLEKLYGADIKGLTQQEWDSVVVKFILPKLLTELSKAFA